MNANVEVTGWTFFIAYNGRLVEMVETFALLCINNMILVVVLLKSATEAIGDLFTVYLCFKMSFSFCFVQIRECNIIPNFSP